jgi:hypothetical protein
MMIDDLDKALNRLRIDVDPVRLALLEERVLSRIRANAIAGSAPGLGTAALAAIGAILLGALSSGPSEADAPGRIVAPFGPSSPLAPSALPATCD